PENAVSASELMKLGASDVLERPVGGEEIRRALGRALALSSRGEQPFSLSAPHPILLGDSKPMRHVDALLRRAAPSNSTVLVRGESGTGKEMIARSVHEMSRRRQGPLVKVHCGALPDTLLESELFGYERGAFTGAVSSKPGRVELAQGGT